MISINLLPWREQRREAHKKKVIQILFLAVIINLLIICVIHIILNQNINKQNRANQSLQQAIQQLNITVIKINQLENQKSEILQKLQQFQSLQDSRALTVSIFNEMPRVLPANMYFIQFTRVGKIITITGNAISNTDIVELMHNLEQVRSLQHPELIEITTLKSPSTYKHAFKLQMTQVER